MDKAYTKLSKKILKMKDIIHDVPRSKVHKIVMDWIKTHPKDMKILSNN